MKPVLKTGVVVLLVAVAGCSTWKHVKPGQTATVQTERFAFDIPSGWTYQRMSRDALTVSRDGPGIQKMESRWYEWDKPLFQGDAERDRLQRDMLPTDIAQQVMAARQREFDIDSLDMVSLTPATVVGADGFRVEYEYRTDRGLRYRGVSYGSIRAQGVYLVTFTAPMLHFYERDFPTFEQIVASGRPLNARETAARSGSR